MRLGYARVSTDEQTLTSQCHRLSAAGCEKLFEEKISGATRNRPKLEKLLEHLRKDDVLVVTRLDRLARSTSELLRIAERITEKKAGLQSLDEPWGKRGKSPGAAGRSGWADAAPDVMVERLDELGAGDLQPAAQIIPDRNANLVAGLE
jgi:resolvase-like protein